MMKVIVIGAGASGLYAGYLLKAQGVEVQVLEARKEAGGRIRTDFSFDPSCPIEDGAAYLHGHNHVFYELASYTETTIEPEVYCECYYWKGQLLSLEEAMKKKKLKKAIRLFKQIHQYRGEEQPLTALLPWQESKLPMHILDGLAFEYGCDLKDFGAASLGLEDSLWNAKGGNYIAPKGLFPVFQELVTDLGDALLCNKIVSHIAYDTQKVSVTCTDGSVYQADKVIVTVPLSVLKSRLIQFEPVLPEAKQEAIQRLGIGAGMKVFLQFTKAIWPKEVTAIIGGEQCPLYELVPASVQHENPILKAYIMGSRAQKLSEKSEEEVVQLLLQELDEILGKESASQHFMKSKRVDWLKEPHIWGAYSFAAPHTMGQRWELALPLENSLYFAGEATHFRGYPATVQGAMETAQWAVEDILHTDEEPPIEETTSA